MDSFDLVIRGGTVVTSSETSRATWASAAAGSWRWGRDLGTAGRR